jgi:hypothetical protein
MSRHHRPTHCPDRAKTSAGAPRSCLSITSFSENAKASQVNAKAPVVAQPRRNKAAAATRPNAGHVAVDIHNVRRQRFHRPIRPGKRERPGHDQDRDRTQDGCRPAFEEFLLRLHRNDALHLPRRDQRLKLIKWLGALTKRSPLPGECVSASDSIPSASPAGAGGTPAIHGGSSRAQTEFALQLPPV